jgi:hypothetical protein
MAVAFVKNHTVASNKTAGTTLALTLDTDVPAGNLIVARVLFDNAATANKPLISSIGVAAGEANVWSLIGTAQSSSTTAGAFVSGQMWFIRTSVSWPAGSYTVTLDTSTVQKAGFFQEFSGVQALQRSTRGFAYSTTTTAASATTSNTLPVIGDLAIGFIFGSNAAANQAGDNDTLDGAWSAVTGVGSTGGNVATNNWGVGQYKIVTGTSHQTLNNSAAMTAGNGAIVTVLQQYVPPAITQAAYQWFDEGTESGAVALAPLNTVATGDVSVNDGIGQLRVRLQSTTAVAPEATNDWQLQWEKNASGTWTNVVPGKTLADSDTNTALSVSGAGGRIWAQSFLGNGEKLSTAAFRMKSTAAVGSPLTAELYTHTGTYGTSGSSPVTLVATSTTTVDIASVSSTDPGTWVYFQFNNTYTLTAATPYFIAVNCPTLSSGNLSIYTPGTGHAGYTKYYASSTWNPSGTDLNFKVFTLPAVVPTTAVGYDSPNLTDGEATTNRLGAGTGSFVAGKVSEDGVVDDLGWTANNYTELLYSLDLVQTDLAHNDTLRFRVLRNGSTEGLTYTQTPTITVTKTEAAVTQAAYRFYADDVGAAVLTDSYPASNRDAASLLYSTSGAAQSFLGNGGQFTRVGFYLGGKLGTPTGTLTARLYAHTGTFGASGSIPTGAPLATSTTTLAPGSVAVAFAWFYFDFVPITLTNGTPYFVSIETTDGAASSSNSVGAGQDNTSTTHPGYRASLFGGSWTTPGAIDLVFEVYTATGEASSTALAAQDTAPAIDTSGGDVNLHLRERLQSTTIAPLPATDDWQLQWEKNSSGTWNNVVASPLLLSSVNNAGAAGGQCGPADREAGQSFMGNGQKLAKAGFPVGKYGNPVGNVVANLYAHSGTFGTSSVSTGTPLATSAPIAAAALVGGWNYFTFDETFTLVNGTPYVISLQGLHSNPTTSDGTIYYYQTSAYGHPGNGCNFSGSTWNYWTGSYDYCHEVYTKGTPAPSTVLAYDDPSLTDGAATTNRLTGGSGTFVPGKVSEDGLVDNLGWSGNNHTEVLYALTLKATDLAVDDTLRFRVLRNGVTTSLTYTQYPSITIGGGVPPQTWTGSVATIGIAGISDAFVAGPPPVTWVGSIAVVGVEGVTGAFVAGDVVWVSTYATVGLVGVSGSFAAGEVTWVGSVATVGVAGQSAPFTAGAVSWVSTFATVGVEGVSQPFVAGETIWVGSIATVGTAGISGTFVAGNSAWPSTFAAVGIEGVSGAFAQSVPWIGSIATIGVEGISKAFSLGQTWAGSFAVVGVEGISKAFAPQQAWIGSIADIGVEGITGVFAPGNTLWQPETVPGPVLIDDTFDGPAGTPLTVVGYDDDGWSPMAVLDGAGNAVVESSRYRGGATNLTPLPDDLWAEWTFSISEPESGGDGYFQIRMPNPQWFHGYNIAFRDYADPEYPGFPASIGLLRDDNPYDSTSTDLPRVGVDTEPGADHTARIEARGANLKVYFDGALLIDWTDSVPLTGIAAGPWSGFSIDDYTDPVGGFKLRSHRAGGLVVPPSFTVGFGGVSGTWTAAPPVIGQWNGQDFVEAQWGAIPVVAMQLGEDTIFAPT